MKIISLLLFLMCATTSTFANDSVCSGVNNWTSSIALVRLKNAGITDDEKIDSAKTEVTRLATEKIGNDLYQLVHRIIFTEKTGKKIEIITNNAVSSGECSTIDVDVFVVSKYLSKP